MIALVPFVRRMFPWVLLAPVVIPLVIGWGLEYPYLVPKTLLFYALALVALAAFAILAFSREPFYVERLRSKLTWIPASLLVLAYVTSLTGIGFYHSFWGVYVRGDGLLMLTCSVALFYLWLLRVDSLLFKNLLTGVLWVSAAVALWGVLEWIVTGGRVESSLGNPAYLAGYLGLAFFLTLARAELAHKNQKPWLYVAAGLDLLAIILTATRGTILALLLAALLTLAFLSYRGVGKVRQWSLGLLAALIITGGLFYVFRAEIVHVPFGPVARIAQTGLQDPNVAGRLFVWQHMLGEIGKSPIVGYGAEHVDALFNNFYDPSVIYEEWFDRSHNAFLDYLAQFGIGGLLLYLALIGALLAAAYEYHKKNKKMGGIFILLTLTYGVQSFFLFDTVSTWWLFLVLLASLLALRKDSVPRALPLPAEPVAGVAIAVIAVLIIIPCSVLPFIANYDLASAYYYAVNDPARSVALLKNGFGLSTYADLEYGYTAYQMYTNKQATYLSGDARLASYTETKDILETNYNRYPYDARTAIFLAHVIALTPAEATPDLELEKEAIDRGISLSPKRAQTWYLKANLSIGAVTKSTSPAERTKDYTEAISVLREYLASVPNLSEPHYVLADLYHALGDTESAAKEAEIGKTDYVPTLGAAHRAVGYYEAVKDWANTEYFLASIHEQNPEDSASYYDLAKAKYLLGDPAGSLVIVKELRLTNPAILQTDPNFVSAITQYEQSAN